MKSRWLQLALLLSLTACSAWAGEVIDRIVAVVNGHALLQSDWEDEVSFEALQNGQPANSATAEARRAAFDRIVERELVRQQMLGIFTPARDAVLRRENEIRAFYPEAKTDAGWDKLLASFNFTQKTIEDAIDAELQTARFVDVRLRPTVKVDSDEIEAYYRDKLVPEIRRKGAEPDPLASVTERINDLLVEQKINQVFIDWIASLRAQSKIEIFMEEEGAEPRPAGDTVEKPGEAKQPGRRP